MCGITGIVSRRPIQRGLVEEMTSDLLHRGPDRQSTWMGNHDKVALGHSRLSILDLSEAGNQPMKSASGKNIIVFNGEIYNHNELRNRFGRKLWSGHSDTEVLLELIEYLGIEKTLEITVGMFAFAIWNNEKKELTIARDRVGEKPLYYGNLNGDFLFSSELRFLRHLNGYSNEINKDAVVHLINSNSIPAPLSIYKNIHKLEPGNYLKVDEKGIIKKKKTYWSIINEYLERDHEKKVDIDFVENKIINAVGSQMEADVPLGAFLSGGIDSSLVVSIMQRLSSEKVKTFSIGFTEDKYNEAKYAKEVSRILGTEHTELYLGPKECLDVIPLISSIYDEPFADSSQVPTFLVSKLARKDVKVVLTGDGGDELFGGYNRYLFCDKYWKRLDRINPQIRGFISKALRKVPVQKYDQILGSITKNKVANLQNKMQKIFDVIDCDSLEKMHKSLINQIQPYENITIHKNESEYFDYGQVTNINNLNDIERLMIMDFISYLPTDILTKVDRASMAHSLETRIPYLDIDVIRASINLDYKYKIRNGETKWILRDMLRKSIPEELIDRPKMGFGVPIDSWLRGPLRDWASDLILNRNLNDNASLNHDEVKKIWKAHQSGFMNNQHKLWNILILLSWLRDNQLN